MSSSDPNPLDRNAKLHDLLERFEKGAAVGPDDTGSQSMPDVGTVDWTGSASKEMQASGLLTTNQPHRQVIADFKIRDYFPRLISVHHLQIALSIFLGLFSLWWPESRVALEVNSTARHLIVFSPLGETAFAFEPVSMSTDGFNQLARGAAYAGVQVLAPGEELTVSYSLKVRC